MIICSNNKLGSYKVNCNPRLMTSQRRTRPGRTTSSFTAVLSSLTLFFINNVTAEMKLIVFSRQCIFHMKVRDINIKLVSGNPTPVGKTRLTLTCFWQFSHSDYLQMLPEILHFYQTGVNWCKALPTLHLSYSPYWT